MPEERNPASTSDDAAAPTEPTAADERRAARAANRFDIRRIIGGLFILYSVILIALGIFGSYHVKHKAAGINVDLWTGLAMLVFGALMVFWALSRPTLPDPDKAAGEGAGPSRAPAT